MAVQRTIVQIELIPVPEMSKGMIDAIVAQCGGWFPRLYRAKLDCGHTVIGVPSDAETPQPLVGQPVSCSVCQVLCN